MQRINIMYIVYSFQIGGLEKCVVDLVNHINRSIFSPSICCLTSSGASADKLVKDVKIFELHKRAGNDLTLPIKIKKLLKQENIKVVHSANWGTYCESIVAAKLARVPVVIHMEQGKEYDEIHQPSIKAWLKARTFYFFSLWVDKIVAVSLDLKQSISRSTRVPFDKIVCIPNSVLLYDEIDKTDMKRRLGLQEDYLIVGSVGRLAKVKNYPCLIEAIPLIKAKVNNVKIIMIGDGPQRTHLESLAKNKGIQEDIVFLGQRMDVRELLGAMDVFVLPSIFEGLSIATLEAMASTLPVVVTNVGGNSEIVVDGETGYLVPHSNPRELADRIIKLLCNSELRQTFGAAAKRRIQNRYSLSAMIKTYEELYLSTLSGKGIRDRRKSEARQET